MANCTELKIWLLKKGITQKELSKETGLHKNTVSKLMRTGEGTKSVKELTRLYLKIKKEEFKTLLEVADGEKER